MKSSKLNSLVSNEALEGGDGELDSGLIASLEKDMGSIRESFGRLMTELLGENYNLDYSGLEITYIGFELLVDLIPEMLGIYGKMVSSATLRPTRSSYSKRTNILQINPAIRYYFLNKKDHDSSLIGSCWYYIDEKRWEYQREGSERIIKFK